MQTRTLSQTSFDQFLAILDPDRDLAGQKYEALRTRIVKFFEWRACRFADDLADETLDRIVRKIDAGVVIEDHINYAYGVARLVYLESYKQQVKEQAVVIEMPIDHKPDDDDEDIRLTCLERCLQTLTENSRSMILHYYRDERRAKIDHRKMLAEKFNISVNALRIKTLRIRTKLEECVIRCVEKGLA
jgi:DNA-directed RNA polymerase specialized sigma24 family protein